MQNLESILSSEIHSFKTLQDLVNSSKFKSILECYDLEKIKEALNGDDSITYRDTMVVFREGSIEFRRTKIALESFDDFIECNALIGQISLSNMLFFGTSLTGSFACDREVIEDLKKIFFNEE